MRSDVGDAAYRSWLRPLALTDVAERKIRIAVAAAVIVGSVVIITLARTAAFSSASRLLRRVATNPRASA